VGNSDCIPLAEVPAAVINTAKRAAACIGNGLYGVDLKESGGKVYVIEVNDNPNIDADVEDIIEGERLYDRLAEDLARRIEAERSHLALVASK
jgi:glutathione synthase/RimK-type ligase-like ATP-grasp enzyme